MALGLISLLRNSLRRTVTMRIRVFFISILLNAEESLFPDSSDIPNSAHPNGKYMETLEHHERRLARFRRTDWRSKRCRTRKQSRRAAKIQNGTTG